MEEEQTLVEWIVSIAALLVAISTINKNWLASKKIRLEIDDLQRKAKKTKRKK